tara:strand:- start:34 stop:1035 length:1002 start_codon:yes stop_codon:yes gene_type:complete
MAYTTIDNPELYFQVRAYTGTGSSHAVTLDGSEDMQPDFIWGKRRNSSAAHELYDSVRGTTKYLVTSSTAAEDTNVNGISAFSSDGFTVAGNSSINATSAPIVAWCWKETATAGFDIVTYTGNSTSGRTEAHSLSAVPHMMIVKIRNDTNNWLVYHHEVAASSPETYWSQLNTTAASGTSGGTGIWNDTAPTSSVFTLGNSGTVNEGYNYVAYLWTGKQGYSKFGSYNGNGETDGIFVYTGFRPAMVLLKSTTSTNGWEMRDNKRPGYNLSTGTLAPNSSDAESTGEGIDILSNGFKCRASGNGQNGSGNRYMYMAFAEAPFVNSNGVPCNAR